MRAPRGHAWIPAVVPTDARRFRVHDAVLAAVLRDAGAELVAHGPDVEIGPIESVRGDAHCAVVPLEAAREEVGSRMLRAGRRVTRSLRIRGEARRTESAVRRCGYRSTAVVTWELEQPLHAPWVPKGRVRPNGAERFPLGALVVGHRSSHMPTALEAAIAKASENNEASWTTPPTVRAGMLVALSATGVLRVAVGPGRFEIDRQREALTLLRRRQPSAAVADRVPWLLNGGRVGLADWSLERRLPGKAEPDQTGGRFVADCVDFLTELFLASRDDPAADKLSRDAEVVASAANITDRDAVISLASAVEYEVSGVRMGFGHGDFWGGNLLEECGRLVGVVDWDGAAPGCLPLLDLFHFRLSAAAWRARRPLGHAIVDELERPGADELTSAYCERIGLEADGGLRRALLAAYWLDYVAYQLRYFVDPLERPKWVRDNVAVVLSALRPSSRRPSVPWSGAA